MSDLTVDRIRLLLTGTAPGPEGVGGIILHDLESFLSPGSLAVVHVTDDSDAARDTQTAGGNSMRVIGCRFERRPKSRFGRMGKAFEWLRMTTANRRRVAGAVHSCADYARSQNVAEVWAVLNTPASIAMAASVARILGVPLRTLVWDDLEHNVRFFGLDRFTAALCRRSFVAAIGDSQSVAVIGETMRDEYYRRYGKAGVILRHGLDVGPKDPGASDMRDLDIAPAAGIVAKPKLRIGFAGSVTARSALKCLLQALDAVEWELAGREIVLVLIGQHFDLRASVPRLIECYGYRSVEDTITLLSTCDVTYLPQPFEVDWRSFATLSFPTKTTTYLAAGAPVLLHAPPHASLPAFFERYPFGARVTELDPDLLCEALRSLCFDDELRSTAREVGARALVEMFSMDCFRDSFFEFLEIEASERDALQVKAGSPDEIIHD